MKRRILSGLRPSGKVHIGSLFGALQNWVRLQDQYECFFEIADWHALTTAYEDTGELRATILDVAIDWLVCGLDPEKSTLFVQSQVPEHAELNLLLSMIVPVSWLQRNPTLKEQVRDLNLGDKVNFGLLGYPVLQAADILAYKAHAVPVGEDQLAHLELSREIARRFNKLYGKTFPEPEALLTEFPRIPGTDGRKMSKSLKNTILISDPPPVVESKVKKAFTDPKKIHKGDKGHPDKCPVFAYHRVFNEDGAEQIRNACRSGKLGCVECKGRVSSQMILHLSPYRERRAPLEAKPGKVKQILREGTERARAVARETIRDAREAMCLLSLE